ncbi:MAG: zf-TFIIB domain-containing protein [Myxococcota bacterium]|nr:zf-TFIIB domain-containing protein [Myxococcota bacterium]
MNCPRCYTAELGERDRQGVKIDVCATCRGVWLDRGELEKLIAHGVAAAAPRRAHGDDDDDADAARRLRRTGGDDHEDDRGKRRWWDIFD